MFLNTYFVCEEGPTIIMCTQTAKKLKLSSTCLRTLFEIFFWNSYFRLYSASQCDIKNFFLDTDICQNLFIAILYCRTTYSINIFFLSFEHVTLWHFVWIGQQMQAELFNIIWKTSQSESSFTLTCFGKSWKNC